MDHLGGDTNMVDLIKLILNEERRRKKLRESDVGIPFRPDHGHEILWDKKNKTHPGYPLVGRLRGLAELRGGIRALNRSAW